MTTTTVVPGNTAETFLTHIFGRGLEGDRYVVERFRRVTATLKTVRELRPAPNEIIICTALNLKRSGIQYWGSISTGLFCDRRQKG